MKRIADLIVRHRQLLLIALLTATLVAGSTVNRKRLEAEALLTSLPVDRSTSAVAVAAYVNERAAAHERDVAALTALIQQTDMDERTRQDAADTLQALVRSRESQQALEDALSATALAPCAAVVSGGSVTIVTAKSAITPEDSALVLALAQAHAGADPEDVRILTAE